MTAPTVLAHEALLHALPFVLPAVLVVALVAAIVWRDRRSERTEAGAGRAREEREQG